MSLAPTPSPVDLVDFIPSPGLAEEECRARLVRCLCAPVEEMADAIMADIRAVDMVSALAKFVTAKETLQDLAQTVRTA